MPVPENAGACRLRGQSRWFAGEDPKPVQRAAGDDELLLLVLNMIAVRRKGRRSTLCIQQFRGLCYCWSGDADDAVGHGGDVEISD